MNEQAHANIFRSAIAALQPELGRRCSGEEELLFRAPNYPDYFDDPTRPEPDKCKIDPQWRKFCDLSGDFAFAGLHFFPAPMTDQYSRMALYTHYFQRMETSYRSGCDRDFVRYAGCLSHAIGDFTQVAHLGPDPNGKILRELLPPPPEKEFAAFHYHRSVEAITGECRATLAGFRALGASAEECAWALAYRGEQSVRFCRRFLIPTIEALFAHDEKRAQELAGIPVTLAAELTRDAIESVARMVDSPVEFSAGLPVMLDLRTIPASAEFHDMVYGGAITDGNLDVPPAGGPLVPGELLLPNGRGMRIPGIGMLPGSGMVGERHAWSSWPLPQKVFSLFTATIGMNRQIARDGAVSFHVELDGREVYQSKRFDAQSAALEIAVPLGAAKMLTLKVCDQNDGKSFWHNHAYWGEPLLTRSEVR
ncbi:MAG: NPCBM/NEW2 domain-containing protein [Victivallaceae bacterium]|nr:NPCBM/NEW2 domain-containing protein [Victivallaceae bacterium]